MPALQRILVTGGAGFIGSALVRHLIAQTPHAVLVLDALIYAGSLSTLAPVAQDPRFRFVRADIRDGAALAQAFADFRPTWVSHLATESHVDGSLDAMPSSRPIWSHLRDAEGGGLLVDPARA